MRNLLIAAVVAAISLVQLGCNTSPEGGSPGTSDNFRIMGPSSTVPTTIKQGDKQTVKISLDRGKDFKKAITLKAEPSKGIHATFDKANVSASDPAEVNLTIEADKDAPLGDGNIKVTATPESGQATGIDIKVKVEAR